MKPDVSIVAPVYNEEHTLPEFIERCVAACAQLDRSWELILVDDGSGDRSLEIAGEAAKQHPGRITSVALNRNYGQHSALIAGFTYARGELILTIDSDLQNPPEEIGRMVAKMDEGYDVVGSVRLNRQDTFFRRIFSSMTNAMVRRVTGVMMHDYGCMFRGYHRSVIDAVLRCPERSTFIPALANSFARNAAEIEVSHAERPAGDSKYSVWKLVNLQFDLVTSISVFPLRMLTVAGLLISVGGIGFGVLLMILRILFGAEWAAEGVFTLFAILFAFVGAQFIGMGLLGEYLGRIYQDVRARPRYSIAEVRSTDPDRSRPSRDVPRTAAPITPTVEVLERAWTADAPSQEHIDL